VESDGGAFALFYIPSREEVEADRAARPRSRVEEAVLALGQQEGIPVESLLPAVSRSPYSLGELYLAEGHWTAVAHDVASQVIASRLAESKRDADRSH